eukprot:gene3215-3692_t
MDKDNEFPFGEEDAFSRQRCFQFIQNAVAVGQWEIAKACMRAYAREYPEEKSQIQSFLVDIFFNPSGMCCGSDTVNSPHHLPWLALQLLTEIYGNEAENLLHSDARTELDFKLFLLSLKPNVNQRILEECLSCYKSGLKVKRRSSKFHQDNGFCKMSKQLQYFISEFAVSDLLNCKILTDYLISSEQQQDVISDRKDDISNSYMRILLTYLGRLELMEEGEQRKLFGECLFILTAAKVYFSSDSRIFCETIISLVRTVMKTAPGLLKLLYSCVIDHASLPFLKLAMETSWSVKLKQLGLTGLASTEDVEEQNVKIASLLSKSLDKRDSIALLTSFQICNYYKVHMFECIIHASLYLIEQGDDDMTLTLLQPSLIQSLKPLVLILAWSKCTTYRKAEGLIKLLWRKRDYETDPVFAAACERLEYNLKVNYICNEKLSELVDVESQPMMFQQLQFNSILSMLNNLDLIRNLPADDVIDILDKQPLFGSQTTTTTGKQARCSSIEATVFLCFQVIQRCLYTYLKTYGRKISLRDLRRVSIDYREDEAELKALIRRVYPLSLRLELLENLFSLLFIRQTDLLETEAGDAVELDFTIESNTSTPSSHLSAPLHGQFLLDPFLEHPHESIKSTTTISDSADGSRFGSEAVSDGFLFSDMAVSSFLELLSDSLVELTAEKFAEKDRGVFTSPTSKAPSAFDQRTSHLGQCVREAIWRLQLVSGFDNEEDVEVKKEKATEDEDSNVSPDLTEDEKKAKCEKMLLSRMLSSPESLVYLCLRKGSNLQAKQVLKMFNLYGTPCAWEVEFAEYFDTTLKELKDKSTQALEPSHASGVSHLSTIKLAAAAGLFSSAVRSIIEKLLLHPYVTSGEGPGAGGRNSGPMVFSAVAVCADLALSGELGSTVCKTVIEKAEALLNECIDRAPIQNLTALLHRIKLLVELYGRMEANLVQNEFDSNPVSSVSDFLRLGYRQMTAGAIELDFQRIARQRESVHQLTEFITAQEMTATTLIEDRGGNDVSSCRKYMNENLSSFSVEKLVFNLEDAPKRDYIKILFRHIDTLARLQLHCESRHRLHGAASLKGTGQQSSFGNIKATNPFVVLKDNMSDIFARLLFEKKYTISPKRLESIAKQVNISIVSVVARKFGLEIPVKKKATYTDLTTFLMTQPRVVLNDTADIESRDLSTASDVQSDDSDPTVVMESLLDKLSKLLSGLPTTYESHVGAKEISNLVSSEKYEEFSRSTALLQDVDLYKLGSEEERLCFMINLFNLMFTHGILFVLGSLTSSSLHRAENADLQSSWSFESVMEKPVGRLALHQFLCYQVGQIGTLSAFDLYRYILLGGVATTFYGESLRANHDLFQWTSEYLTHSPNKEEYRSLFLISHGSTGCPALKIFKPSTLEDQLKNATRNFLERTVKVDPSRLKVTLPKLIYWHRGIFLPRQPLTSSLRTASSIDYKDCDYALLQFIGNESSKLHDQLKYVSKDNLSVVYSEHNWTLNLNHDISVAKKRTGGHSRKPSDVAVERKGKSSLSEPMNEYLAEASPVTNTLIVLALEQRDLVDQVDTMIVRSKSVAKRIDSNQVASLIDYVEKGITNMQESVKRSKTLKAYFSDGFNLFMKTIRSVRHDEKLVTESYVKACQVLVKNWLSSINPFNPIDIQYTSILPQLIDFFMLYGGFEVSPLVTALPRLFPAAVKDRLLCECIMEIADRLSDLFETNTSLYDGGVQFDIDRIAVLAKELRHSILLIEDPFLKCQTALQSVCYFDCNDALDILEICAEDCCGEESMMRELKQEAAKIRWYEQILDIIKQRAKESGSSITAPISVTKWQDVIELVQVHPDYITILLVSMDSYHLVHFWVHNFSVPHKLSKICLHAKIHDLLKKTQTDYVVLYSELETLRNKHMTLEICQDVLNNPDISSQQTLLLIQYVMENLTHLLDDSQYKQLLYRQLSVTAMLNFPESMKSSCRHLACFPVLILEQLLMNMKIEHAKTVVESFRNNISHQSELKSLLDELDETIKAYAKKSLSVPVVETVLQPEAKPTVIVPKKSSKKHARNESYSKSPHQIQVLTEDDKSAVGSYKTKVLQRIADGESFQAPLRPIERNLWFSDKSVSTCMACNIQVFNTFNRRHHCRHCGRITCADCSVHRCPVPGYAAQVRVCQQCFEQVYDPTKNVQDKQREHLAHLTVDSPAGSPSSQNMNLGESLTTENVADSCLNGNKKQIDVDWQLTTDPDKNEEIRNDFYFDQAPSASLCINIIDLYSDAQRSGGMLLKFCNDLSKHLNEKNRSEATSYHDIDNAMVVGMIEFLLFNAKVKFMKAGDIHGVELCDSYIAHVEVLKLLLNSDWQDIPTMQDLSHPEIIRRLRDRLFESERYLLAIDVTRKCGLDASTVWFAWGLSQLKSGDFMCARENFSKCLTPVKTEGSKALQQNAYYLTQIVDIIESSPLLSHMMDEDLLAPLMVLSEQRRGSFTGCLLDKRRYDEIMFYLATYGSYGHVVKYFVRNGLYRKAAIYIRDRKCNEEVFIEDLIMRSFQNGTFEDLARELKDIDSSLIVWKDYLNKACQYLYRKGHVHCLYEMQRFMKDHFRAAKTCIRFFLGTSGKPAGSFKELRSRLNYLDTAKAHLETLLKDRAILRQPTFVSHVHGSFLGDDKPVVVSQEASTSDVKSHLNTIDLQIKVLNFINKSKSSDAQVEGKVPTLFGNGKERGDLVSKLLIVSMNDAFPLVSRIIQDYRLPVGAVFKDCVNKLAELRSYDVVVELMKNIEATGMIAEKGRDELLLHIIRRISEQGGQINALILCGRLRDAYIESLKGDRVDEIERILQEAERGHQRHIVDICQKYLANYKEKQERRTRPR